MELPQFKKIYLIEYAHRVLGNFIGLAFGLPMVYFLARGYFKNKMKLRMLGLLGLGGMQGVVGWWMVKSGLLPKPGYQSEARVHLTQLGVSLQTLCTFEFCHSLVLTDFMEWNDTDEKFAGNDMETSTY